MSDRRTAQHGRRFLLVHPDLLRAIRQARGLSVAQLAAACGVTAKTVRNWEHGRHGTQRGIYHDHAVRLLRTLRQDPKHPEVLGTFFDPIGSAHDPATHGSAMPYD